MAEENIYCECMEEIKARLHLLAAFFNQGRTTGSEATDIEFGCLQFRKVLELIPELAVFFEHAFGDNSKVLVAF